MSAVYLIRTYCLSTMLCGCELCSLSGSSRRKINVAWIVVGEILGRLPVLRT